MHWGCVRCLQRSASSIAARTAWAVSGAGNDALGLREQHGRLEDGVLRIGHRFEDAEVLQMADDRRHAVIPQPAGVDAATA